MKTKIQKNLALLLMLAMVLSVVPFGAFAAVPDEEIDTAKTGSITVTKYANTNASAPKGDATGTSVDEGSIDPSYTKLKGATFKLFKIADANKVLEYYDGKTVVDAYDISLFSYDETTGATYNGSPVAEVLPEKTTDASGVCKFENLPVGIYALKEVTAPDQIVAPLAEACLISIPMVNAAYQGGGGSNNNGNAKWMYDVFVYPKNHEATGTVELTKTNQNGTGLENVVFELYKKEFDSSGHLPATWEPVTTTVSNNGTVIYLSGNSSDPTLKTGSGGLITLANLPANLHGTQYKLVEVYKSGVSPEGYIINSNPLYFKVNKDNTMTWNAASGEEGDCNNTNTGVVGTTITAAPKLSITLRNELPSLIKQVQENGGTAWKQDEQYRLDDEITYRLIAYVPNNITEIIGKYTITDLPDLGIDDSLVWTDYTVSYANTAADFDDSTPDSPLTMGTHYTLSSHNDTGKGQGFKLVLNDGTAAGKYIQIVYKARMNANAKIADIGNGNTATLTYSKFIDNLGDPTSVYTITDEARVYTYQYRITKYKDSVSDSNKLAAGETVDFQLLDASKNQIPVIKLEEGKYRLAIPSDTLPADPYTMTTKSDSTLLIQGLENGTYYLRETRTIDGYNLLSAPFEITLNVSENTLWNSAGWQAGTAPVAQYKVEHHYASTTYGVAEAMGTGTIVNKKGFVLPQTGGMGYLLFCTAGLVLIAGGALLIFGGRKKKIR